MPKILIDGNRRIVDHVPGSSDRSTWAAILTSNTTWRSVLVRSYPASFHVGHVLSSDGTSASLVDDSHDIEKIETRRQEVGRWASEVANNLVIYREAALGTDMAAAFFDYRLMMISAAMTDSNLLNEATWAIVRANLVSFQTFMTYTWDRWTRRTLREAMRGGRTFYKMSETGDPADSQNTLYIPVEDSSVTMTSIGNQARMRL